MVGNAFDAVRLGQQQQQQQQQQKQQQQTTTQRHRSGLLITPYCNGHRHVHVPPSFSYRNKQ